MILCPMNFRSKNDNSKRGEVCVKFISCRTQTPDTQYELDFADHKAVMAFTVIGVVSVWNERKKIGGVKFEPDADFRSFLRLTFSPGSWSRKKGHGGAVAERSKALLCRKKINENQKIPGSLEPYPSLRHSLQKN